MLTFCGQWAENSRESLLPSPFPLCASPCQPAGHRNMVTALSRLHGENFLTDGGGLDFISFIAGLFAPLEGWIEGAAKGRKNFILSHPYKNPQLGKVLVSACVCVWIWMCESWFFSFSYSYLHQPTHFTAGDRKERILPLDSQSIRDI